MDLMRFVRAEWDRLAGYGFLVAGAVALVFGFVGVRTSADVIDEIVVRTDGVPLFVEEMTKTVLEAGAAAGGAADAPPPIAIPASIEDSLMARLDRLSSAREVAQLSAALGREFS